MFRKCAISMRMWPYWLLFIDRQLLRNPFTSGKLCRSAFAVNALHTCRLTLYREVGFHNMSHNGLTLLTIPVDRQKKGHGDETSWCTVLCHILMYCAVGRTKGMRFSEWMKKTTEWLWQKENKWVGEKESRQDRRKKVKKYSKKYMQEIQQSQPKSTVHKRKRSWVQM